MSWHDKILKGSRNNYKPKVSSTWYTEVLGDPSQKVKSKKAKTTRSHNSIPNFDLSTVEKIDHLDLNDYFLFLKQHTKENRIVYPFPKEGIRKSKFKNPSYFYLIIFVNPQFFKEKIEKMKEIEQIFVNKTGYLQFNTLLSESQFITSLKINGSTIIPKKILNRNMYSLNDEIKKGLIKEKDLFLIAIK